MSQSDEFEKKAKALLDDSLDDISPDISRRLQQARNAALDQAKPRSAWSFPVPALAASFAIAALTVTLLVNFDETKTGTTELAMENDIEMLIANEDIDLVEDLEFMQWLAESEEYAS